jgi:hypothetical protein
VLARDKPRLLWVGAIAVVLGVVHLIVGRPFPYGWILIGFGVLALLTWVGLSRRGV